MVCHLASEHNEFWCEHCKSECWTIETALKFTRPQMKENKKLILLSVVNDCNAYSSSSSTGSGGGSGSRQPRSQMLKLSRLTLDWATVHWLSTRKHAAKSKLSPLAARHSNLGSRLLAPVWMHLHLPKLKSKIERDCRLCLVGATRSTTATTWSLL